MRKPARIPTAETADGFEGQEILHATLDGQAYSAVAHLIFAG